MMMTKNAIAETNGVGEFDDEEAQLSREDRRFRRHFNLALLRLRRMGKLSRKEAHQMRVASFNTMGIPGICGGGDEAFITIIRKECQQVASGMFDTLMEWWGMLVAWIVENWEAILKMILPLLLFI